MKLASWNIENLAPWLRGERDLVSRVAELGHPDVFLLQEVKIRPRDSELVLAMAHALPDYECYASLCDDPRNVSFRGGRAYGVATYIRKELGPIKARVPAWDHEGRVIVTTVGDLSIVNVYAVNGTSKPYVDPATGEPKGDRHEHKRRFQDHVFMLANELRGFGGVIVAGDWNVSQTERDTTPSLRTEAPHVKARAELAAHLERTGFVDIYRARHADDREYTWFRRGPALDAARVDFALVSPDLVSKVREVTIEPRRKAGLGTDHVSFALTLG